MKLKRQALIVGGAVLFAVPGCSGETSDPSPLNDQGTVPRDSMTQADSAAVDSTVPTDSSSPADVAPISEDALVSSDASQADASEPPEDAGGPVLDANAPTDSAVAADQGPIPDAMMPIDMAIVPDANVEPDQGMAGACADLVGEACDGFNTGCCEAGQPVLFCRGGQFIHEDIGLPCDCRVRDGVGDVARAVPGFVGIHAANRMRIRAPRLRDLLT